MDVRTQIIHAAMEEFGDKGMKFTMSDIAARISISKKTIYTVFDNKEDLFLCTVKYCFDSIKNSEMKILEDPSLSTTEKLRRILGVLPEGYRDLDFRRLYVLKDKYPQIYQAVEERLETGWDRTIALIEQGMEEGCFRPVHIPVFKTMLEATLEQFFRRDVLLESGIVYQEALQEVVNILVDGISKK